MDKYGAPDRGDGTSSLDTVVDRTSRKFNDIVAKMSHVLNRPIGSVPGGADYTQIAGNPQAHAATLQTMMAQSGPMKGLVSFIEFVEAGNGRTR